MEVNEFDQSINCTSQQNMTPELSDGVRWIMGKPCSSAWADARRHEENPWMWLNRNEELINIKVETTSTISKVKERPLRSAWRQRQWLRCEQWDGFPGWACQCQFLRIGNRIVPFQPVDEACSPDQLCEELLRIAIKTRSTRISSLTATMQWSTVSEWERVWFFK